MGSDNLAKGAAWELGFCKQKGKELESVFEKETLE